MLYRGDIFWLVAAHRTQADYVRNLQADPRVRVKADGAWRTGTAVVLPGDDAVARSRTLPYQWDAAIGRMTASAPLTIRIDLDPGPRAGHKGFQVTLTAHTLLGRILRGGAPRTSITRGLRPGR